MQLFWTLLSLDTAKLSNTKHMKNLLFIASCAIMLFSCQNHAQPKPSEINMNEIQVAKETIYQFKVEDLSGNTFDFSTLKGKKIMVVNTASKCGLTPQYEKLQKIYEKYKNQNFDQTVVCAWDIHDWGHNIGRAFNCFVNVQWSK